MTETLFAGSELVERRAASYEARLALVQARIGAYHDEMVNRRAAMDEADQLKRRIAGARNFLSGEYDRTYAGPWGPYTDIQGYREHYADDALGAALHHLLWAEHFAGMRTRESARELDPFNARRAS